MRVLCKVYKCVGGENKKGTKSKFGSVVFSVHPHIGGCFVGLVFGFEGSFVRDSVHDATIVKYNEYLLCFATLSVAPAVTTHNPQ